MSEVVLSNTEAMARLGARDVVMSRFLDAALQHLTASQCTEITKLFRCGIEDAMSLMDDVALPAEYHATLLAQTNLLLARLSVKRKG